MRRCAVLIGIAFVSGCVHQATFRVGYPPGARLASGDPPLAALEIEELRDERGERYFPSQSRLFLAYVPFLPYVQLPYERFDESVAILSDLRERTTNPAPPLADYAFSRSFARAIAADLAATGMFASVRCVEAGTSEGSRFLLQGSLRSSGLRMTISSYGLGFAGVLFWVLPVPMSKTTGEVDIDLALVDRRRGDRIWSGTLSAEMSGFQTLYHGSIQYGAAGGMFRGVEIARMPAGSTPDQNSLFSWSFAALRRAMEDARLEIVRAAGEAGP